MKTEHDKDKSLVGGFLNGLRAIESFGPDAQRQTISDVARATGLNRATSRRLLLTLVHAGYAEQDGRYFRLTPRTLGLSQAYIGGATLPNLLQTYLERLSAEIHESCSASVLEGGQVVYIARASYQRVMSINLHVGSRLPIHCSSMGRVLLAAKPREVARSMLEQTELVRYTPNTCTDLELLMEIVAQVARDQYCVVDQELEVGLRSLAVPICNPSGETLAAINIGTNAARVSVEMLLNEFLPKLTELRTMVEKRL